MKRVLYILGLLHDNDIDWLIAAGRRRSISPGTSIVDEGENLDSLFLVLDGKFAVVLGSGRKVAELSAGEIVGEISLLDSRPTTATVTAETESEVLEIPRADLNARLETNADFGSRFYRALAIFLAQRLRSSVLQLGFGESGQEEDASDADEIDPDLLDAVDLAGKRFKWIVDRIRHTP